MSIVKEEKGGEWSRRRRVEEREQKGGEEVRRVEESGGE